MCVRYYCHCLPTILQKLSDYKGKLIRQQEVTKVVSVCVRVHTYSAIRSQRQRYENVTCGTFDVVCRASRMMWLFGRVDTCCYLQADWSVQPRRKDESHRLL